jgi:hypothetical protein
MSFEAPRKSLFDLRLRRVEESGEDHPDACVYVLLPTLEELFGRPDFGRHDPIFLPGTARPLDGWALFGSVRERGLVLH